MAEHIMLDTADMKLLADRLMLGAQALPVAVTKVLAEAGQVVEDRVRANAGATGSSVVAGSVRGHASAEEYTIDAGTENDPIAGLWEFGNRGGGRSPDFWHPVFGEGAVMQPRHPFMMPAARSQHSRVLAKAYAAYEIAFSPVGLAPLP